MNRYPKSPEIGLLQWFHLEEYERAEQTIKDLKELGVSFLRTGISWADLYRPEGKAWYHWLLPKLSRHFELLPCFTYTPPSLGIKAKTSSPPRNTKDYADTLDMLITEYGQYFDYIELWNEPNNKSEWDFALDPGWEKFADMIIKAAYWARQRGKKTVLGGMSPISPNWLNGMGDQGVLRHIDVLGFHGFPDTFDPDFKGWHKNIEAVKEVLDKHQSAARLWITECGFSTWQLKEFKQAEEFKKLLQLDVDRVYWYSLYDLQADKETVDGFHLDEREYFFGIKKANGKLESLPLKETPSGYAPSDPAFREGINEGQPLHFHSPYACSKGAADQYVCDFSRLYNIPATVFRMSSIYGPHQFGSEEQAWVAHFLRQTLRKQEIRLFGNGKQLRDMLFVGDLLKAMEMTRRKIDQFSGEVYNIGGGVENALSLLEVVRLAERLNGTKSPVTFADSCSDESLYYVSDYRKFKKKTGWKPKVHYHQGLKQLLEWMIRRDEERPFRNIKAVKM